MSEISELKIEIEKLKERNKKVDSLKAWETSLTRKLVIAILTYFVISLFFIFTSNNSPLISAIVPTLGFILSTLSISFIRDFWIKNRK